MKTISDSFRQQIVGTDVEFAFGIKITRTDNTVFAFTDHNKPVTVSGTVYQPTNGAAFSSLDGKSDMAVDTLKTVTLTSTSLSEADLLSGKFDNATLEVFGFLWSDAGSGTIPFKRGRIGEVEARQVDFGAEVRGLAAHLQQNFVEMTSLLCRYDLGDTRCTVVLEPPDWTATTAMTEVQAGDHSVGSRVSPTSYNGRQFKATTGGTTGGSEPTWNTTIGGTTTDGSVTWTTELALMQEGTVSAWYDKQHFEASGLDTLTDTDDFFKYGELTWLTGDNAGFSKEVREHKSGQRFTLWDEMYYEPEVGDTFKVHRGCPHRFTEDCIGIFDNGDNFGGEPFLPGPDEAFDFPDAK